MAYTPIGNGIYLGVAADTKPTAPTTNSIFIEYDTGIISRYSSGAWAAITSNNKSETLTNKTISASSNTITDASGAAGDLLVHNGTKFLRLARGTAGQYLKTNVGATNIGWETETLTVYLDDLQDATITTPGRNQVMRYDSSAWVNSPEPTFGEKVGTWVAGPTDTAGTGLLDIVTVTSIDTMSDVTNATNGHARKFGNNAVNTNAMGISQTTSFFQRQWNARMICKFGVPSSNSNTRVWIGFSSSSTLPTGEDALANLSGVFFGIPRVSTGTPPDTNYMIYHNSGDATTTFVDSGLVRSTTSSNTAVLNVEIAMNSTDVKVYGSLETNPLSLLATLTTDIPAASTALFPIVAAQRGGGAGVKALDVYKVMVGTI